MRQMSKKSANSKNKRRGDVASGMMALVRRQPGIGYFAALYALKAEGYSVNTDGSATLIGYYKNACEKVRGVSRSEERHCMELRKRIRRARRG